jgi:uncharacterized 2Fe-2S/4Fe-4S cluster protein (DUF4445 family)
MKVKIRFKPLDREAGVEPGTSLLLAAQLAGIVLESDCGGMGRCGKCKLVVTGGVTALTPREREYLTPFEIGQKVRLACQAMVRRPTSVSLLTLPFGKEHILEEGISRSVELHLSLKKFYLDLNAEDLKKEQPIDEIIAGVFDRQGIREPQIGFSCLKTLPLLLHHNRDGLTAVTKDNEIIGFELGDTTNKILGLAVDIGTTTVVGYLFDLNQGKLIGVGSALNKQSVHGSDVISRIDHALQAPEGLSQLQKLVVETINGVIENLCRSNNLSNDDIYSLVMVGNTTMAHLFLGMSPLFLSRFPYNPLTSKALGVAPQVLGINMSGLGRVFCFPLVSGFIGSDTVAVVLSTGLHRSRVPKMAIDIGTNGEIVLTDGKVMLASSCAAGPAFEGAHIQCGMRGTSGAIDRVDFVKGKVRCHVIDEVPAKGVCGSGLVDAVAGMLKAGLIGGDGRLLTKEEVPNSPYARLLAHGKYNQFVVSSGKRSGGGDVVITQKDIRELQLAKGAMMAGIRILMDRLGLGEQDIREVYLAGAFGNYLRPESALAIGLLPVLPKAKITQVGNAAGSGAKMALLSTRAMKEAGKIAEQIEYVELAKIPDFQQQFVKGMMFSRRT